MSSEVLANYLETERRHRALSDGSVLRDTAEQTLHGLPDGALTLLARTNAARMLCAAVAVLREDPTTVQDAPVGRQDWRPTAGSLMIEFEVSPGMLESLREALPTLEIHVVKLSQRSAVAAN